MSGNQMDQECIKLCDTINKFEGIRTVESCCGHGEHNYRIWFIANDLKYLAPVIYYFAA